MSHFRFGGYHIFLSIFSLFSFFFLGPHLWHMEVPGLWVKLELQLPAYAIATAMWDPSCLCNLYQSSQQCWILNPLSETRDRTCILMNTSWVFNLLSHSGNSGYHIFLKDSSPLFCWVPDFFFFSFLKVTNYFNCTKINVRRERTP